MSKGRLFTPEIEEFIKNNCLGKYTDELTKMVNSKFNTNFTTEQVLGLKRRRRYKSYINGEDGRFQKGAVSLTKGTKVTPAHYEKSKKGMFKRGHTPKSWLAIGSEIVDKSGYIQVKINDIHYARHCENWAFKHKLIYEQHVGPIPEGYAVIFADGNKRNFDLDNLVLVTRAELLYLNRHHMIYKDSNLTKSSVAVAKLVTTANKKKRSKKEKKQYG